MRVHPRPMRDSWQVCIAHAYVISPRGQEGELQQLGLLDSEWLTAKVPHQGTSLPPQIQKKAVLMARSKKRSSHDTETIIDRLFKRFRESGVVPTNQEANDTTKTAVSVGILPAETGR